MALYPLLRPAPVPARPRARARPVAAGAARCIGAVPPLRALQRRRLPRVDDPVTALGLRFPNRVGLAAGYDKDARALLGPRRARLRPPRDRHGDAAAAAGQPAAAALPAGRGPLGDQPPRASPARAPQWSPGACAGGRGEWSSASTSASSARRRSSAAVDDYLALLETFAPLADYLTVNVSSPNTPGLRLLEAGRAGWRGCSSRCVRRRGRAGASRRGAVPLLVKLSPDLAAEDLDAVGRCGAGGRHRRHRRHQHHAGARRRPLAPRQAKRAASRERC